MKKLQKNGLKILKIFHLLFAVMWIGGVLALVCLQLGAKPQTAEMMYISAISHLVVDKWFLIPGGIGIGLTGLIYGLFTNWGFFKYRWLTIKWVLTIALRILGVGYMGVTIKANAIYAEQLLEGAAADLYWQNVYGVAAAGVVQLVGFLCIVIVSVLKYKRK